MSRVFLSEHPVRYMAYMRVQFWPVATSRQNRGIYVSGRFPLDTITML